MPNIPEIGVRNINIREIRPNPIFDLNTPRILVPNVPITTRLQKPIVAYPGCVEHAEAVEDNQKSIHCDGQIPHYEPINFEPEQMNIIRPTGMPKTEGEKEEEVPPPQPPVLPPSTASVTKEAVPPPKETEEVITPKPQIPWTQKYLPEPAAVTTTASIALIATTSALLAKPLADLLLKTIKPTVKKVTKKIAKMRGKKEVVLSLQERRQEQSETNHAKLALRKMLGKK